MSSVVDDLFARAEADEALGALLPALDRSVPVWLVGGRVRDLLAGTEGYDVDLAVEGDVLGVAEAIASAVDGEVVVHDRFGTATVEAQSGAVDLARTRTETYPVPGALPEVEPASIEEDLRRRDFTVNAMALAVAGDRRGEFLDPHRGRADLEAGLIRVLHPDSFSDDPTRLLRAARYAGRLDFELEAGTAEQGRAAIGAGAMGTVSGPRIADELMLLLGEFLSTPAALAIVAALGLDVALDPSLRADPELVAAVQLGTLETGAEPPLASLAALGVRDAEGFASWVDTLGLRATVRDLVVGAARDAPGVAESVGDVPWASRLYRILRPLSAEGLALALGLGAPAEPILRYVNELQHARLAITGDDLVAAGAPESPAIGRALDATLDRYLDGELPTREEQLEAALTIARVAS